MQGQRLGKPLAQGRGRRRILPGQGPLQRVELGFRRRVRGRGRTWGSIGEVDDSSPKPDYKTA